MELFVPPSAHEAQTENLIVPMSPHPRREMPTPDKLQQLNISSSFTRCTLTQKLLNLYKKNSIQVLYPSENQGVFSISHYTSMHRCICFLEFLYGRKRDFAIILLIIPTAGEN